MSQIKKRVSIILKIICASIFIGIIVGFIAAFFGRVLLLITQFRYEHVSKLLPFLGICGFLSVRAYQKWGKESVKGMNLIFEAGHGDTKTVPFRMIPFVIISTWFTHLFGGSVGREGVAVQIGATVGFRAGSFLGDKESSKILLIAGMAAGFSGLYRTPFAAVFFALEVLVAGQLSYKALIPTLIASFIAFVTSGLCGLEKFSVDMGAVDPVFSFSTSDYRALMLLIVKILILGCVFGFCGRGFSLALRATKKQFSKKIKDPALKALVIGMGVSLFLFLIGKGRYAGLGINLISDSFNGESIFAWDWILKFLFTVITLSAGYQGGEVTPLFAIGASLGIFLGGLLGLPIMVCAALGYASVFGSASNTLLAPIFIGCEVFGYEYLPLFFVVCIIAYACNGNNTIYPKQRILL